MSEAGFWATFFSWIFLVTILTGGTPDLIDAFIYALTGWEPINVN